jgi:hypothetical protein
LIFSAMIANKAGAEHVVLIPGDSGGRKENFDCAGRATLVPPSGQFNSDLAGISRTIHPRSALFRTPRSAFRIQNIPGKPTHKLFRPAGAMDASSSDKSRAARARIVPLGDARTIRKGTSIRESNLPDRMHK